MNPNKGLTTEQVEEMIEDKLSSYTDKIDELTNELSEVRSRLLHDVDNKFSMLQLKGGMTIGDLSPVWIGNGGVIALTKRPVQSTDSISMFAGTDKKISGSKTISTYNTELVVQNQQDSLCAIFAAGNNTFSNYSGRIQVTNGGTSITDDTFGFTPGILVNSFINILNDSGHQESIRISANTATTVTVESAFTVPTGDYSYDIIRGVLLGAAQYPYRRAYVENGTFGGVRFGIGPTGAGDNSLLYSDGTNLMYRRNNGSVVTVA